MKKTLFVISILAVMMTAGCSTGSTGKTVLVTEEPVPVVEATAEPTEAVAEAPAPEVKTTDGTARIDAVGFIGALIDSGCTVVKAEYKEVNRGGGISVTCADIPMINTDVLNAKGLEGL